MSQIETAAAPKRGLPATHPGEVLREIVLPDLKAHGVPATAVAERLGVSRRTLYDILQAKAAVTPEMALRLGRLFGNGPDIWLNLQRAWDLERAQERLGPQLEAIEALQLEP